MVGLVAQEQRLVVAGREEVAAVRRVRVVALEVVHELAGEIQPPLEDVEQRGGKEDHGVGEGATLRTASSAVYQQSSSAFRSCTRPRCTRDFKPDREMPSIAAAGFLGQPLPTR